MSKFFPQKLSNLGLLLNKLLQLKRITEGEWGQSPQALGNFCDFAEKIAILTPFQSLFTRFGNHMNNYNKLLKFRIYQKNHFA